MALVAGSDTSRQRRTSRRALLISLAAFGMGALGAPACSPAAPSPTAAPKAPSTPAAAPTQPAAAPKPAAPRPEGSPPPKPAAKAPTVLEQSKVKYGVITGTFDNIWSLMGVRKGFYKEIGLDVEVSEINSGVTRQKGLMAGELDFAELGPSNITIPVAEGADLRIVAGVKPGNPYLMYTNRKDITKPADLVGKSVGHGGVNSTLHLLTLSLLDKYNIDPSKVNFANVGPSADLIKAVFAGKVDAGPSGAEFMPEAEKYPDVKVVANLAVELPNFLKAILAVQVKTLKSKPETLTAFLIGQMRGVRYAFDNRDEAIAYGVELFGRDRKDIEWSYDWYVQNKIVSPALEVTPQQVKSVQDVHVKVGIQQKVVPFEDVADLTALKRTLEILGPYKPK